MASSPAGADPRECLKQPGHLVQIDTNSRVMHFDANDVSRLAATNQDVAARISVLDRVSQQVAQNRTEQQFVTLNDRAALDHSKPDAFFQGVKFAFTTNLLN